MSHYELVQDTISFIATVGALNAFRWPCYNSLRQEDLYEGDISRWDAYLFACRVYCPEPGPSLAILKPHLEPLVVVPGDCLDQLIDGPRVDEQPLDETPEIRLCRAYQPESLALTWSALGQLLFFQRRPGLLVRISDGLASPLLQLPDGLTRHFIKWFLRCILNYGQPLDKEEPYVECRDSRLEHTLLHGQGAERDYTCMDCAGLQVLSTDGLFQVALIEAYDGDLQFNGVISDELLAQVVGEATSVVRQEENIDEQDVFVIVAVTYHVKIFHLSVTDVYLRRFRDLEPGEATHELSTFLPIESTIWWDLTNREDRKTFILHIMAMISWADEASRFLKLKPMS